MALARVKNWTAEVLTYSDLNAEFNNVLNNANSLISPFTGNVDGGGFLLSKLGSLIIGNTSTAITAGSAHATQLLGTSATTTGEILGMYSADAVGSSLVFAKSRNATIGSHTIVQSGDVLGQITAYGSNGSSMDPAAAIVFKSGGAPGAATDMPGKIVFQVTPDGSATLADALTINANKTLVAAGYTSDGGILYADGSGNITQDAAVTVGSGFVSATLTGGLGALQGKQTSSGANVFYCWNSATSGDNPFCTFGTEASFTQRGSIDYNRGGGAVRYNTTSDARLKDVMGNAPYDPTWIDRVQVKQFAWKDSGNVTIGALAQELIDVCPDAVSKGDDGAKLAFDAEGKCTSRIWGTDPSKLIWNLVLEIQELRKRVAALGG